jgi:glutaredoxin 2
MPSHEKGKPAAQNPQAASGGNGCAGVMRLYLFEHCSICFRVRMAAALKRLHLQETVVLEDDTETMVKLVGKRVVPILIKDDGVPMLESMDMVAHIDSLGAPIFVGPQRAELAIWASNTADRTAPLTWPRYPLLGLPEFGTIAAHDHYVVRKRKRLGNLAELRARTRELVDALMPNLEKLSAMIESPTALNGKLSLDDIRVLPLLRSAAVVKGLRFPQKVRDYFETMMSRIGYQPLPAV